VKLGDAGKLIFHGRFQVIKKKVKLNKSLFRSSSSN